LEYKKILTFLITLILYVNYENYIKEDTQKLYRTKSSLEMKINKELALQQQHISKDDLLLDLDSLMFDSKTHSYSQAMGEMQKEIKLSAKDGCRVKKVRWAQVATNEDWYEKLRINVSLECQPNDIFKFNNNLKKSKKLYVIENFKISKDRRKEMLHFNMYVVGFRIKNVK